MERTMVNMKDISYAKKWRAPFSKLKEIGLMFISYPYGNLGALDKFPVNPAFILGCPRSGTSILERILSLHPDIVNYSEAIWVWDFRDINPMRDHLKSSRNVSSFDRNRIRRTFGFYQKIHNKPIFINKNPRSSVRISYIREIFPESKIIHIVRDGRAVVHSIINRINKESHRKKIPLGKFCKPLDWKRIYKLPMLERHAYQWTGIIEEINRQKSNVDPEKWIDIRYEDLNLYPERVLSKVFSFLRRDLTDTQKRDMIKLMYPMNLKWKTNMRREDIEKMSGIMKKWLDYYGYSDD